MDEKKYIISENELRELLYARNVLAALERDGVDNWWGYMESVDEYIADCMETMSRFKDVPRDGLFDMISDGYDLDCLSEDELQLYDKYEPEYRIRSIDLCQDWSGLQTPNN